MKKGERVIGRMPHDDRGKDWCGTAVKKENTRIDSHHQKPGRSKDRFFPEFQRKPDPADTLIFGLVATRNCETINFSCFKSPSLWYLVTAQP
jgi:hypothetical protein